MQFQQLQEQYQMFATQRAQMELQFKELETTTERLTGVSDDAPLYRTIGSILVKVDERSKLKDELTERKETLSRRVESMKGQEERLKQRLESMGNELNRKIKDSGIG